VGGWFEVGFGFGFGSGSGAHGRLCLVRVSIGGVVTRAESSRVLYPPFSSSQCLQKKWLQAASVLQGPADKSHYVVVRCADLGRYLCASRKSWAQTTRETRELKIMSESPRQFLESKNNACNEAVASFGRTRTERVPRRARCGETGGW
jgi:hypothetical protein